MRTMLSRVVCIAGLASYVAGCDAPASWDATSFALAGLVDLGPPNEFLAGDITVTLSDIVGCDGVKSFAFTANDAPVSFSPTSKDGGLTGSIAATNLPFPTGVGTVAPVKLALTASCDGTPLATATRDLSLFPVAHVHDPAFAVSDDVIANATATVWGSNGALYLCTSDDVGSHIVRVARNAEMASIDLPGPEICTTFFAEGVSLVSTSDGRLLVSRRIVIDEDSLAILADSGPESMFAENGGVWERFGGAPQVLLDPETFTEVRTVTGDAFSNFDIFADDGDTTTAAGLRGIGSKIQFFVRRFTNTSQEEVASVDLFTTVGNNVPYDMFPVKLDQGAGVMVVWQGTGNDAGKTVVNVFDVTRTEPGTPVATSRIDAVCSLPEGGIIGGRFAPRSSRSQRGVALACDGPAVAFIDGGGVVTFVTLPPGALALFGVFNVDDEAVLIETTSGTHWVSIADGTAVRMPSLVNAIFDADGQAHFGVNGALASRDLYARMQGQ